MNEVDIHAYRKHGVLGAEKEYTAEKAKSSPCMLSKEAISAVFLHLSPRALGCLKVHVASIITSTLDSTWYSQVPSTYEPHALLAICRPLYLRVRADLQAEAVELSERMRHVPIPPALSPASSPMGSRCVR